MMSKTTVFIILAKCLKFTWERYIEKNKAQRGRYDLRWIQSIPRKQNPNAYVISLIFPSWRVEEKRSLIQLFKFYYWTWFLVGITNESNVHSSLHQVDSLWRGPPYASVQMKLRRRKFCNNKWNIVNNISTNSYSEEYYL